MARQRCEFANSIKQQHGSGKSTRHDATIAARNGMRKAIGPIGTRQRAEKAASFRRESMNTGLRNAEASAMKKTQRTAEANAGKEEKKQ